MGFKKHCDNWVCKRQLQKLWRLRSSCCLPILLWTFWILASKLRGVTIWCDMTASFMGLFKISNPPSWLSLPQQSICSIRTPSIIAGEQLHHLISLICRLSELPKQKLINLKENLEFLLSRHYLNWPVLNLYGSLVCVIQGLVTQLGLPLMLVL